MKWRILKRTNAVRRSSSQTGTKILLVPGKSGKLDLDAVEHAITRRADIHYPKPRVLSITQTTELGTVYEQSEITAATALAEKHGLKVHMDGARFANAVAALELKPADLTWKAGVDVLCLGGAKNGTAIGEAVVFFDHGLAAEFEYRCKQAGQLASKMRFISAPWIGMLESGAWLENAKRANRMAALLADRVSGIRGVSLMFPTQANALFLQMDEGISGRLRNAGWRFYSFIGAGGARFMCSWQTTEDDVNALADAIRKASAEG